MSLQQRRDADADAGEFPTPGSVPASPSDAVAQEGLLAEAGSLTRELRALLHEQLELVVLESRLALRTVTTMIALSVAAAVLLVSAWLTLVGTAVVLLMSLGLSAALAMVFATAVNFLGAAILFLALRRLWRSLGWPATLRTLKPGSAAPAVAR